jgi:hypothetical protein
MLMFAGCALNAVRPPTPASSLSVDRCEPPPPCEQYYLLIWSAQRVPKSPAYAHSFVTVVHTLEPEEAPLQILDAHTISWLPATLKIRVYAHHPEPGVNLTLRETLDYACMNRERVSLWGPYECRTSHYRRFLVQKEFLETSGVGYQCNDNWGETARIGDGTNCIHAITDKDPEFGRDNYPMIWFGDAASEHIAYRLRNRGTILEPAVTHDEVLAALGLGDYPIRRRQFDDRFIDFPRRQPARVLRYLPIDRQRQAPPYAYPPFPPPGPRFDPFPG